MNIADDIRAAYHTLAAQPGAYVYIARIRDALGEAHNRWEVDAALVKLDQDPDVHLIPESNQKVLTDMERDLAVNIGNQDKHLIAIFSD
jgi:hypothetical protein